MLRPDDIQVIEILLLDKHMHISEVAKRFKVTRQRIWQICKKHNIIIHRAIKRICFHCGNEFTAKRSRVRNGGALYCQESCYFNHKREVGDYQPRRQGQRIGRKKIEDWLGSSLPDGCIVHHEDGNQNKNEFKNIFIFPSNIAHLKYHHAKRHNNAVLPYKEMWELPDKLAEWFPE